MLFYFDFLKLQFFFISFQKLPTKKIQFRHRFPFHFPVTAVVDILQIFGQLHPNVCVYMVLQAQLVSNPLEAGTKEQHTTIVPVCFFMPLLLGLSKAYVARMKPQNR
jgi:hypothetical protein